MSGRNRLAGCTLSLAAGVLCACGSADTPQSAGDTAGADGGFDPCTLISKVEADSIVPGNEGGYVAHAGKSLIDGVDAFQCSYLSKPGPALTVILNVAVDDARFEDIKPDFSLINAARHVDAGDRGWMLERDDMVKVTSVVKRTVIEVALFAPEARSKSAQVEALAKVVAQRVGKRS